MKKNLFFFPIALSIIFFSVSCEKTAGTGGQAGINGKVFAKKYNGNYTVLLNQYYSPSEDVYIIYGTGTAYSDNTKTSFDGSYKFSYLQEGHYRVFSYSVDTTSKPYNKKIAVLQDVDINEETQTATAPDLVIVK